jgi:2-keto-4-pentenoate hydratase/2-oxohepta-3-ene-1,7-dioic acid hydratase in catechol pathway
MIELPVSRQRITSPRLFCIGRNYAAHAAEMKSEVPGSPMVFLKPSTAIVRTGGSVILPAASRDVHHEVELVAVIGKGGKGIAERDALGHVEAYAAGLDMTARDLQAVAKQKGHPWTVAKGFDTFAPLGDFVAAEAVGDPQQLSIRLTVNGAIRQDGHTSDMIFPVARLVAYCSTIFTLLPGDLLYTGTPEGVGPVHAGDALTVEIDGMPPLSVDVRQETEGV